MHYFITFVVLGVLFAAIDAIWLKSTNTFYKKQLGNVLRGKPNFIAAIVFYIIYIFGVVVFVLLPAFHSEMWWRAGAMGALFGLVAYATYDLTNLATLKGWPLKLVVVDILWGMLVTSISSMLTYSIVTGWF